MTADESYVIPALVLGKVITALGVVRSLGRKGIPLYGLGAERTFVTHSRWYRPLPIPNRAAIAEGNLDFLESLPVARMVLIPCSDTWALAAAGLSQPLRERFPVSTGSRASVEALVDKGRFAETVKPLDVPHPLTVRVTPGDDVAAILGGGYENAFLKPCNSQAFRHHYGVKGFFLRTRAEAETRLADARAAGLDVLVQDYIPGPPTAHYFVDGFRDRHGRFCGLFARQRVRMWPEDFGSSTSTVSVALESVSEAVKSVERLLDAIAYRGIFSAEFKRDSRDGHLKILEVNPRPWWQTGFATACGVNVCEMAYRDALQWDVEPTRSYVVGRHHVYAYYDRFSCWHAFRLGRLSLREWFRAWRSAHHATFAWNDPLPAVAFLLEELGNSVRRRLGKDTP